MNSFVTDYLRALKENNALGLKQGHMTLDDSLPCYVYRELEVPDNRFVRSSDPFMSSYRTLRGVKYDVKPTIPRKIEFQSVVYLKEGIIDYVFRDEKVTLIFVGDGNSDKRFSYNCYRLFQTFGERYRIVCFICNLDIKGTFNSLPVVLGWDGESATQSLFYHAKEWNELSVILEYVRTEKKREPSRCFMALVDIDGTYLCPRPHHNIVIKDSRRKAITNFCNQYFDDGFFSGAEDDLQRLNESYQLASQTAFSMSYDDEDLTMLIALGIYGKIIEPDDPLLTGKDKVGFVIPIEYLTYGLFLLDSLSSSRRGLSRLRMLYQTCADALNHGSPTAFEAFRQHEEAVLRERGLEGEVTLNREVAKFIVESANEDVVSIAYSDRPNASMGLFSNKDVYYTISPASKSLMTTPLQLD